MSAASQSVASQYQRHQWLTEAAVQGVAACAWKRLGYAELAGISAARAAHYAFLAQPDLREQA